MPEPTRTDGVWRVMRFEHPDGKYAWVASDQFGPEQIPVPPGYRFVSSTRMIAAEVTDEMVDRAAREQYRLDTHGLTQWESAPDEDRAEYLAEARLVLVAALNLEAPDA